MTLTKILIACGAAAMALGLSACVVSQPALGPDFGVAVRQDVAAQIADPGARYGRTPTDGANVLSAQQRYRTGEVVQPTSTKTSSVAGSGGGGGGAAGTPTGPGPQ